MKTTLYTICGGLILGTSLHFLTGAADWQEAQPLKGSATKVAATGKQPVPHAPLQQVDYLSTIDGDTIIVRLRGSGDTRPVHVRLLGINAADLHDGQSAAFRAALTVSEDMETAQGVWLESDPDALSDKYGRLLRWVWYSRGVAAAPVPPDGRVNLSVELARAHQVAIYAGKNGSAWYSQDLKQ